MFTVTMYRKGIPQGNVQVNKREEILAAVGSIVAASGNGSASYAVRFEDQNGSGGWILVGSAHGDKPGISDLPRKARQPHCNE